MLSELAKKGKAHWGYPYSWLKLWEKDLSIDLKLLNESITYVLKCDDEISGFCLLQAKTDFIEIEHFWLKTELIGKGLGGRLLKHALKEFKNKYPRMEVTADPQARGFYEKFGFKFLKEIPSQPKGRSIPRLTLEFE